MVQSKLIREKLMKTKFAVISICFGILFGFASCDDYLDGIKDAASLAPKPPTLEGYVDSAGVARFTITNRGENLGGDDPVKIFTLYYAEGEYDSVDSVPESEEINTKPVLDCPASGEFASNFYNFTGNYTFWITAHDFDGSDESKPSNLVILEF
jgi:hypothetical protein